VILLNPGETILCHTQEFIGARRGATTMMKTRSSLGRNFIETCKCAGWGDVGYVSRWTMEVTNISSFIVPLVVGMRVAQIVFFPVEGVSGDYESNGGKYAGRGPWDPSMMLPKLHLEARMPALTREEESRLVTEAAALL
jgi:dCTP deaminase